MTGMNAPIAPVVEYVTEEVSRQGHDVTVQDGIQRVGWMLTAWSYALEWDAGNAETRPEIKDAIALGRIIEARKVKGIRTVAVRVGSRKCPDPETIERSLEELWVKRDTLKPLEFYKEFEMIHPFVDGNGRTGKILLNWLNGTLLDPVFPPADLFGHPIRNP